MVAVDAVSGLENVEPESWARRALSTLARGKLLQGVPGRLLQGERPLNRLEFAAALAAALDALDTLIVGGEEHLTHTDLAVLERLQADFEPELALLRVRTAALEAKAGNLEANLFSPTAKLDGSVVLALNGGGGGAGSRLFTGFPDTSPAFGDALGASPVPATAANVTFLARSSLNLQASITGGDLLFLRLRGVAGYDIGALLPGIAGGLGPLFYAGGPNGTSYDQSTSAVATDGRATVSIDELYYTTDIDDNAKFRFLAAGRVNIGQLIDTNSFANNEEVDFSNGSFLNNQLITLSASSFFGPGFGLAWQINDAMRLRAIYTAGNGGAVSGDARNRLNAFGAPVGGFGAGGLFGGQTASVIELRIDPGPAASIKLQYARVVEQGAVLATVMPEAIRNSTNDAYGINAEWAITPHFALFGRYGIASTQVNAFDGYAFSGVRSNTWHVGFALPNLFAPGNNLSVAYGQPVRVFAGTATGLTAAGLTTSLVPSGTEGNIEIFYRLRLNDRVSLTPDLQFIVQPVHSRNSNGLAVGTLRAVFEF
ncbi:iron uptake porin [Gloeobacter violaceus]|nr:iron uptake porin [Gloeobacter violaceus]